MHYTYTKTSEKNLHFDTWSSQRVVLNWSWIREPLSPEKESLFKYKLLGPQRHRKYLEIFNINISISTIDLPKILNRKDFCTKDFYTINMFIGPVYKGLDTRTSIIDCIQGPLLKGLGTVLLIQGALYKYFCKRTFIRRVYKGLYVKDFQYI